MQSSPSIQGFPLPADVNPPDSICYEIHVPNDPAYVQAFYGALFDLTQWINWQRDSAHTGTLAARVWRQIWIDVVTHPNNCQDCAIPIAESDYEMSICEQLRFQNGKLQGLCCGVWEDIGGQPSQGITGGQPGPSTQPAPGGGCQDYQGDMGGAAPWYVPTVVSTGDTINIHDTSGSFYDAGNGRWFCADGSEFFVTCTGITFTNSGAQMPTVPTGRIVAKIGSVYYDVLGSVFTVPGGHSNDPVQLEMNTNSPAGSGGDVHFTVTVCNNAAAAWSHTFNFELGPQGFVPIISAGLPTAVWETGQGWANKDFQNVPGEWFRGAVAQLTGITPFAMTSVQLKLNFARGTWNSPTDLGIQVAFSDGSTPILILNPTTVTADGQILFGVNNVTGITSMSFNATTDSNLASPAGFTGHALVTSLTIAGTGPNPF